MENVYIVVGSSGEYEDFSQWNVRAFLKPQAAHALKKRLNAAAKAHGIDGYQHDFASREAFKAAVGKLDPNMGYLDYTGVSYTVEKVPLA